MAPLDGGKVAKVVVGQQNVGVVPAVVRVGGSGLAIDVIGDAPRQMRFIEADYQTVDTIGIGKKDDAFQGVVMEIVADFVNRVVMRG